jgi:hypothetical protein
VVRGRKINPILRCCKSFFALHWQTDERTFNWEHVQYRPACHQQKTTDWQKIKNRNGDTALY